jgi:hypothetical protein
MSIETIVLIALGAIIGGYAHASWCRGREFDRAIRQMLSLMEEFGIRDEGRGRN